MNEIIIEWAPSAKAWGIKIIDVATGKSIGTCVNMEVHCDPGSRITAELTLFADEDGRPVFDGLPAVMDGEPWTGVFSFVVAEMRVRAS